MLDLLNSLSLKSGAVIVVIASILLSIALVRVHLKPLKWVLALGAPFLFAYCLYWAPVWLGGSSEQYHIWAPLFILPWSVAGALASSLVILLIAVRRSGIR
jgi:hypothetical protein